MKETISKCENCGNHETGRIWSSSWTGELQHETREYNRPNLVMDRNTTSASFSSTTRITLNPSQRLTQKHMPEFDIDPEPVNLFELGDTYIFTHYFDNKEVFSNLKKWYNPHEYRFEIPENDLDQAAQILEKYYLKPVIIEDPTPYTVATSPETEYSEILRDSVYHSQEHGKHVFIMKDNLSVRVAKEQGAEKPESPDPIGEEVVITDE